MPPYVPFVFALALCYLLHVLPEATTQLHVRSCRFQDSVFFFDLKCIRFSLWILHALKLLAVSRHVQRMLPQNVTM